ncbi:MAG: hypothetical protein IJU56_04290 [Clostridia bacterium]|nr:hypothetical protein [Clostridia bacterium]
MRTINRKALALLLSLLLVFSLAGFAFAETPQEVNYNGNPIVVVGGYGGAQLKLTENGEVIWYMDTDAIMHDLLQNLIRIVPDLALMKARHPEYIAKTLRPYLEKYLGKFKTDENGESVYDISPTLEPTAESAHYTQIEDSADMDLLTHLEGIVPLEQCYFLGFDLRSHAIDNANRLKQLIDSVLETTGAEKVDLMGQSYGGQVIATYLSLYPQEAGKKVENAALFVPAMGGATLAYDVLMDQVSLDERSLLEYIEFGFSWETDFHQLLNTSPEFLVDDLVKAVMPQILEIAGTWPSLWDFVPLELFDEAIKKLDEVKNAKLIADTTYYHEQIMAKYHENLTKAQNAGTTISIIAGAGAQALSGSLLNSDGIIPVSGSTGAVAAPFGKRFNDGYTARGTTCSDPQHRHISPSMELDLSTAYLPENTWVCDGLYHGMEEFDEWSRALFIRQAFSKNPLQSVHEDKRFSQFHAASNASTGLLARFDHSPEGYLCGDDSALLVKNYSASKMLVLDISSQNAGIDFENVYRVLAPGETAAFSLCGELQKVSAVKTDVTVTYTLLGTSSATPTAQRRLDFTIMNGPKAPFDKAHPLTDADAEYDYFSYTGPLASFCIKKSGLSETLNVLFKILERLQKTLTGFVFNTKRS